jgi:hypothetical protein
MPKPVNGRIGGVPALGQPVPEAQDDGPPVPGNQGR